MEHMCVGQDELKLIKAVRKLDNTSPLCCPWEKNSAQVWDLEIPSWFLELLTKLSGMGERVMLALCSVCEDAFLTSTMLLRTGVPPVISSSSPCTGGNCDTCSSGPCCASLWFDLCFHRRNCFGAALEYPKHSTCILSITFSGKDNGFFSSVRVRNCHVPSIKCWFKQGWFLYRFSAAGNRNCLL